MPQQKNIQIEPNGKIVIPNDKASDWVIDTRDANDIFHQLSQMDNGLLDILFQVAEKDQELVGSLFLTMIRGKVSEKNIVKGSISNTKGDVIVGDNNTRIYNYITLEQTKKHSKELTLNIPKLRPDQIIGRENDLTDLHQRLFDNKQVVLMNGMGGIGKTTLAQVYLTKYYEDYQHVAWIELNPESESLEFDFINAEGLLERFNIKKQDRTPQELFTALIAAIREIKTKPNLLVLDNASQRLAPYYEFLPTQPNWHVLVTSRQEIPNFDKKELDFLSEAEAIALFKKHYTLPQLQGDFLKKLVADLEYHTLTIEILAKTAQDQRTPPDQLTNALAEDLAADVHIPQR